MPATKSLIRTTRPCRRGLRSSGKIAPGTTLAPVQSILARLSRRRQITQFGPGRAAAPLTETGGVGWRRRSTARETFLRGMSHCSSGLAVHKVRCRGPEQQSKLNDSCDTGIMVRPARRYHIKVPTVTFSTNRPEIPERDLFWCYWWRGVSAQLALVGRAVASTARGDRGGVSIGDPHAYAARSRCR
jgi:hypothetical protein